jgi:hypothetical protein
VEKPVQNPAALPQASVKKSTYDELNQTAANTNKFMM